MIYLDNNATTATDKKVLEEMLPFLSGEYANPSFEAQVETLGKAASSNLMSTETQVDELWGDTKDDEWKAKEVERIKAEKGIVSGGDEPPAVGEFTA